MVTMCFVDDAKDWYISLKISKKTPPWPKLVDEVLEFFSDNSGNPIDQFKRVQQRGRVDDYAKEFLRAKSRLICKTQIENEFFLGSFVSGLKEEIRNNLDLFEPSNLKLAIRFAKKIEVSLEGSSKRVHYSSRPVISKFRKTVTVLSENGRVIRLRFNLRKQVALHH